MKYTLSVSFLMFVLSGMSVVSAALYKGFDAQGRVVYSDRPFEDAKKIKQPSVSVVARDDKKPEAVAEEKKPVEFKYMSFDIVSPTENQAIRYGTDVTVSLQVKPGINTEKNHAIWLLVDGRSRFENTQSLSFQLDGLSLGGHKIQGQIRDSEGNIVARTRTTTVVIYKNALP